MKKISLKKTSAVLMTALMALGSTMNNIGTYFNDSMQITAAAAQSQQEAMCEQAIAEEGYIEGSNNDNKYGAALGNNNVSWCALFLSYIARSLSIPESVIKTNAWAGSMSGSERTGNFGGYYFPKSYVSDGRFTPAKGDFVYYDGLDVNGESGHVELVLSYDPELQTIDSIGGNTSTPGGGRDGVWRHNGRSLRTSGTSTTIIGFERPNYSGDNTLDIDTELNIDYPRPTTILSYNIKTKNPEVAWIQVALNRLGYDCGEVDMLYGSKTKAQILNLQRDYGLEVDGEAGPITVGLIVDLLKPTPKPIYDIDTELNIDYPRPTTILSYNIKTKNPEVAWIQVALNRLGYDCGEVDMLYGSKTKAQILNLQRDYGLEVDGEAGPITVGLIVDLLKPTPKPVTTTELVTTNITTTTTLTTTTSKPIITTTTTTTTVQDTEVVTKPEPPKQTGVVKGVDVSVCQGLIDWNAVKSSGIQFAVLRAATTYPAAFKVDELFEQNYAGAKEAGLKVGTYFYTTATNVDEMYNDITRLLHVLDGKQIELGVFLDIEDPLQATLDKAELTEIVEYGCSLLRESGYQPGVYANNNFFCSCLDSDALRANDIKIWRAAWISDKDDFPDYDHSEECTIWQYRVSMADEVPGISGQVDLDVLYIDTESDSTDTSDVTTPELNGDVNCDGVVDVSDAVLLSRFCTEDATVIMTAQGKSVADTNDDGEIDLEDTIVILKLIAKLV